MQAFLKVKEYWFNVSPDLTKEGLQILIDNSRVNFFQKLGEIEKQM